MAPSFIPRNHQERTNNGVMEHGLSHAKQLVQRLSPVLQISPVNFNNAPRRFLRTWIENHEEYQAPGPLASSLSDTKNEAHTTFRWPLGRPF